MTKSEEIDLETDVAVQSKVELPPAAKRALAEAAERRAAHEALQVKARTNAKELGGPKGNEPTRYGDWERGGRAVDF